MSPNNVNTTSISYSNGDSRTGNGVVIQLRFGVFCSRFHLSYSPLTTIKSFSVFVLNGLCSCPTPSLLLQEETRILFLSFLSPLPFLLSSFFSFFPFPPSVLRQNYVRLLYFYLKNWISSGSFRWLTYLFTPFLSLVSSIIFNFKYLMVLSFIWYFWQKLNYY